MKTTFYFFFFCFIAIAALSCTKESAKPTGSIMLVNNSSNPYDVYINGKLKIDDMPGNSAQQLSSTPVGYYSVRVVQVSGYLLYPTDLTFSGDLSNESTMVVSFPD